MVEDYFGFGWDFLTMVEVFQSQSRFFFSLSLYFLILDFCIDGTDKNNQLSRPKSESTNSFLTCRYQNWNLEPISPSNDTILFENRDHQAYNIVHPLHFIFLSKIAKLKLTVGWRMCWHSKENVRRQRLAELRKSLF